MDKPTVYIETSIVSYLAARPSRDPVTARNQQLTHKWWNTRRQQYALYTSEFVLREAARGDPHLAQQRLALLASIPLLQSQVAAADLATELQRQVPLPPQASEDAMHIALAAMSGMACVLTWNCKHIANPRLRERIERVCALWGVQVPILSTPGDWK